MRFFINLTNLLFLYIYSQNQISSFAYLRCFEFDREAESRNELRAIEILCKREGANSPHADVHAFNPRSFPVRGNYVKDCRLSRTHSRVSPTRNIVQRSPCEFRELTDATLQHLQRRTRTSQNVTEAIEVALRRRACDHFQQPAVRVFVLRRQGGPGRQRLFYAT